MEKTEIKVSCIDQVLKITDAPILASGGLSEVRVVFSFCEKWNGFEKTAIFYRADEPVYYSILDENDTCIVPWEVCYEDGTFYFGVFGDKGETRRTSLEVKYKVKKGAITADTMPSDPTPEVYDQIMSLLGEIKDSQAGFISVAEKAVVDAQTAAQEAQTATANANTATTNANQATQSANTAASDANANAGRAETAAQRAETASANAEKATEDTNAFLAEANTALQEIRDLVVDADEPLAIVCESSGEVITLTDASDRLLRGLTLYGKTTQNGTPTPEAPVALENAGSDGSIGVSVTGKNLFGGEALADKLVEVAKATKDTEAGTVTYTGKNVSGKILYDAFKPNTRYTFIFYGQYKTSGTSRVANMALKYTDGSSSGVFNFSTAGEDSYAVVTSDENKTVSLLYGNYIGNNTTLYYDKCGIFEGVLTEADFVPYEGQTLSVSTPNGLPGIPVSSGGNYTDESGQQWVCDEIDFARGMYVQNTARITVDTATRLEYKSSNTSGKYLALYKPIQTVADAPLLCNAYAQISTDGNQKTGVKNWGLSVAVHDERFSDQNTAVSLLTEMGFEAIYPLYAPIETPLPAEELAAFAALHTYKPDTTVSNDSGAGMGVSYVADTKTYIDQKLAAISAALLNA